MALEKTFEDTFEVPYTIDIVWPVFSNVKLINCWNKSFELSDIDCLKNQGFYYHKDKERNFRKLFLIEEIFREENKKVKYSIENLTFGKKNNQMEIELQANLATTTITFSRYLDLSVFFLRKKETVLEHYREHHVNLISNLKKLNYSELLINGLN
jgi:hypothetical protein